MERAPTLRCFHKYMYMPENMLEGLSLSDAYQISLLKMQLDVEDSDFTPELQLAIAIIGPNFPVANWHTL